MNINIYCYEIALQRITVLTASLKTIKVWMLHLSLIAKMIVANLKCVLLFNAVLKKLLWDQTLQTA